LPKCGYTVIVSFLLPSSLSPPSRSSVPHRPFCLLVAAVVASTPFFLPPLIRPPILASATGWFPALLIVPPLYTAFADRAQDFQQCVEVQNGSERSSQTTRLERRPAHARLETRLTLRIQFDFINTQEFTDTGFIMRMKCVASLSESSFQF